MFPTSWKRDPVTGDYYCTECGDLVSRPFCGVRMCSCNQFDASEQLGFQSNRSQKIGENNGRKSDSL